MSRPRSTPEPPADAEPTEVEVGFDPELDAALRAVLQIIYKQHPLSPNQILVLASELQRLGVHRLVEAHLRKYSYRREGGGSQ